jgi:hypothetical protein
MQKGAAGLEAPAAAAGVSEPSAAAAAFYTIELTRGSSWDQPAEKLDERECDTDNIQVAVAVARNWLEQVKRYEPERGATHYRIVDPSGAVAGGPA